MRELQKIISIAIIVSLVLSLNFGLIFNKPKKAQAFLGISDITHDIISNVMDVTAKIKEYGLDGIARFIARQAMNRLRYNLIRWAQGGFRADNNPLSINSWKGFFKDAINFGSSRFIHEFNLTALCNPIKFTIGDKLGLNQNYYNIPYYSGFQYYGSCTLKKVVGNVDAFFENPSISLYGWDTWTALGLPNNNVWGVMLLAAERRAELESEEKEEAEHEGDAGQGYKDEKECVATSVEACQENCEFFAIADFSENDNCIIDCGGDSNPFDADPGCVEQCCKDRCEQETGDECVEERTKNLSATVHDTMEKTTTSDMDWLITTDEITELVEVFISSILNKVVFSSGLVKNNYSASTSSKTTNKENYDYHKAYKGIITSDVVYSIKSSALARILNSVQEMNRQMLTCDKDSAINIAQIARTYAEILESEVESLYTSIEGIDLKPDYMILDRAQSDVIANNLAGGIGFSWPNLDWLNYPEQCKKILKEQDLSGTGYRCSSITSNLPPFSYDPDCDSCLFSHNELNCTPAPFPTWDNDIATTITRDLKLQKWDTYNTCKATFATVGNICSDCLKAAEQTCEQNTDPTKKLDCILRVCDNFEPVNDIITAQGAFSSLIANGYDFYNRCLAEEAKTHCYTCLKEHYVPAAYCSQIADYIGQAAVKYPTTYRVSEDGIFGWDSMNADEVGWIGAKQSDFCENDTEFNSGQTSVSQICKIMPDYAFSFGTGLYADNCQTRCPFTSIYTEEMLYDINDDRPNPGDCGYAMFLTGGLPGGWVVEDGTFEMQSKCCTALTAHREDRYSVCFAGSGGTTTEPPEDHADPFCPAAIAACPNWAWASGWDASWDNFEQAWTSDTVADEAGATTNSITWADQPFNSILPAGNSSEYHVISIAGQQGTRIRITRPYCWVPGQAGCPCTDNSSYDRCLATIPDDAACRILGREIRDGYTRNTAPSNDSRRHADIASGKASGSFEPMWVPDPRFESGGQWEAYGYCSYCPENKTNTSCFFGPNSSYSWHGDPEDPDPGHPGAPNIRHIIRMDDPNTATVETYQRWTDFNQSGDTCYSNSTCDSSVDESFCGNYISRTVPLNPGMYWMTYGHEDDGVRRGGAAICVDN